MGTMLNSKISILTGEMAGAMNALDNRLDTRIQTEVEERHDAEDHRGHRAPAEARDE